MGFKDYFAPGKAKKNKTEIPVGMADLYSTTPRPAFTGQSTPLGSVPASIYPDGDFRNATVGDINEIKCDVMVNWLYSQQMELLWTAGDHDEGVVLKKGQGAYTCCPSDLIDEHAGFFDAVQALNMRVVMTVNTKVIKLFLRGNTDPYVPLGDGLRLQVLPSMAYLPGCQKHQSAAFIADRGILVGGTANIFVNDDGMQPLSQDEAQARQDFYDEHSIGWVAQDGTTPFIRCGKSKKASNMNYGLWISNRVEEKLVNIFRPETWTQADEGAAYRQAIGAVVDEDEGRTWCDGNIRIGDYILLIDSDTRDPPDCLLDAVSEMEQSPQVAIIQF
ncbi:hypothetical protein LTR66_010567 [Elasticomyces elasticus]|nr:hypothetical protein LTR66_010567 [Elasticomyces elasticus]